jgi:hypothetical protein
MNFPAYSGKEAIYCGRHKMVNITACEEPEVRKTSSQLDKYLLKIPSKSEQCLTPLSRKGL